MISKERERERERESLSESKKCFIMSTLQKLWTSFRSVLFSKRCLRKWVSLSLTHLSLPLSRGWICLHTHTDTHHCREHLMNGYVIFLVVSLQGVTFFFLLLLLSSLVFLLISSPLLLSSLTSVVSPSFNSHLALFLQFFSFPPFFSSFSLFSLPRSLFSLSLFTSNSFLMCRTWRVKGKDGNRLMSIEQRMKGEHKKRREKERERKEGVGITQQFNGAVKVE